MLKFKNGRNCTIVFLAAILAVGFGLIPNHALAKDVKVLRIGIGVDADTINPIALTTAIPANICELLYDTIFKPGEGGAILPNLATEYSVSDDGLIYTIKLRKGIKSIDGAPFSAQTLKRHLEVYQDPAVRVPFRFLFAPVKSLTVVDDYTVQYHLHAPYAPFIQIFTVLCIPSQKAITPYDAEKLNQNPVGAGPYKLLEWVRGERIVLVRNDGYWGEKPTVEKVVYQIIPETATRVAMLRAGQLDVAYSPTPADVPSLEADPSMAVDRPLSTRIIYIGMNCQKGPTKDKLVRQAFNYAVDKEAITQKILFNIAKPMDAPIPPTFFGYSRMENQYAYDPDKARALLKQANFSMDTVISMHSPTGRYTYDKQVAEAVQAYLKDIGVKTTLRTYDWPTYNAMTYTPLEKNELELFLLGWGWPFYDADGILALIFAGSQWPPGSNSTFYKNPKFDRAVGEARQIMDSEKRKALYKQATTLVWNDAPVIWLYIEPFSIAYHSKFQGMDAKAHERFYPTYVTMK